MSRTLSQLAAGTKIYCNTTLSGEDAATAFIVMGMSEQGNSVLLMPELVYQQKRMNATDVAEYNGCEMDTYLSAETDGFRTAYLSEAFRNCLVPTQIKCYSLTDSQEITIARDIFVPSYTEMGWTSDHPEGASLLAALKTFKGVTNDNQARIANNTAGTACTWWLRSANSSSQFRSVYVNGSAYSNDASHSWNWLRPLLSVAPATLVSDEGEDTIYLFPDSAAAYREIDIKISMGQSVKRPKKARVLVEITNATESSVKVTNNYKDESPTWVTVPDGGVATLENATKTSENWELGLQIYAKSGGRATVQEPILVVETEETA